MTTIYAENKGSASVSVNVTGDIDSGDAGITALSATGMVTVTMRGDIDADGNGIYAENKGSATVTVDSIGDIDAGGNAIFAASSQGIIDVDSIGNLTAAAGYGIYAVNSGSNVVTVNSTGNIDAGNRGIYAQSATGAVTVVTSGNVTSDSDAIFAQNLGGNAVQITNTGDLSAGNAGDGIYAFSATGLVTVNSTGDIWAGSDGIFARNTGFSTVSVTSLGNISATSAYGIYGYSANGAVTIQSTGAIDSGDHGIYALNLGYGAVSVTQVGDIDAGGSGIRATSTAGSVTVNNDGDVKAGGDGIFASTLGIATVSVINNGDIDAGGYGIHGFSAGAVTVNNTGAILSGSDGIFAQTLGTSLISVTQVGDIDAGGYGVFANSTAGNTIVNTTGDIESVNHGIYALTNGDTLIDIDHEGSITSTTGYGISATSIANGTIEVSVDGGTVSGALDGIRVTSWGAMDVTLGEDATVSGTSGYAAVRFVNGLDIQLTNYGTIYNTGGVNEFAVVSAQNDTTVDNYGTISGSVLLGPWSNPFNNYSGALFNMGDTVNIGADSALTNSGTLSPGGVGNVATTTLTGVLVNEATGTLLFDVDMDNALADRIDVTNSASLDGDLRLNFVSANGTPDTYTIITTGSGVTTQSLTLLNPFVLGDINYVNGGNDVELSINGFDFTPAGLGDNAAAIGNSIQGSIEGSGGLGPIAVALLNLPTLEEAENALNQLSPNIYVADQIGAVQDIDTFSDGMLSCRMASGENAFGAEGECAWGRFVYSDYDLEGNGDLTGFSSRSTEIMGGVQMAIEETAWRIGGSLGYRSSDRDGESGSSSEGDTFSAGAVVKYAPGPYLLAAAVSASRGTYDTLRPIDIGGGFTDLLSGETDVTTVSGRLRAAYTMESGAFYLRPMVDASVTHVRTGAFTESGGIASVSTDGFDNTVLALMPAVEIGGQVSIGDDMLLRPYLRGGVNFYSGNDYSLTGVFTADGNAATPFTIGTTSDDLLWTVSTGVDILKGDMGTLQIFYEGAFSEATSINAGGAKISVNF